MNPGGPDVLYVTTSSGVLRYDPASDELGSVILMRDRQWTGFFGIVHHERSGSILAACRHRLGTKKVRKHSTDVLLYRIDPRSETAEEVAAIHDVHDVHQIATWDDTLCLTDTGLNRLHLFDLAAGVTSEVLPVGPERDDVHHLNALLVHGEDLLVGLNNRGRRDAEILRLPLPVLAAGEGNRDALTIGSVYSVSGYLHTHDLESHDDGLICCASHDGLVLRADEPEVLFEVNGWARGLAVAEDYIWVGVSRFAERSRRHSGELNGELRRFDPSTGECLQQVVLGGAGQVNDLLAFTADR